MNQKIVLRVLLLTMCFVFLLALLKTSTESYASVDLPERVYQIYGVSSQEVNGNSRVKFVTINYDGEVKRDFSRAYSPVTALIDSGYSVSNKNRIISTSPISNLKNHSYILVQTYRTTIDEILFEIPYETIYNGTVLCKSLSQEVQEQEGVLGIMEQRIKKTYKGDRLVAEEIIEENVKREARPEIVVIRGPQDLPSSVPQRGYDCGYWNTYIDSSVTATDEEKQWLRFIMKCESGCKAENDRAFYKGLFQWHPCFWYKQFPNDNIFDGEAQIKRTLQKLREGANPNQMWPGCHRRYRASYGELSWLQ